MVLPNTPPPKLMCSADWRFEEIDDDCEWVELYRPGGYHPVAIGDTFHNGRYKVLRKLGEGSFSTVWLVVRSGVPKYAALKIMSAESSTTSAEVAVLSHLSQEAPTDPGFQNITKLLDSFQHEGPNGVHQCLVIELMGSSAASLVEDLPEDNPEVSKYPRRYPIAMAKKILLHTLRGLRFVHKNGLVHGDLQPGNILFAIESLDEVEEQELKQNEAKTKVPVKRIDGKADKWAPSNLYLRQTLHEHVKLGANLCVKLSDFGAAFFLADPPACPTTPIGLRAPESILKHSPSSGIDIWSFGCLIYEFLTSEPLFAVMAFGSDDTADDDHFAQLHDKIGRLPESIMREWKGASKWYGLKDEQLCPHGQYKPYESLEVRFEKHKHPDIGDEEADIICQLIRKVLVYDPAERPSAEELLKHPWFAD